MELEEQKYVGGLWWSISSLQRILKQAFEISGEIKIQKYEADWEDFVDLDDFVDWSKLRVLKKVWFLLLAEKGFVSK